MVVKKENFASARTRARCCVIHVPVSWRSRAGSSSSCMCLLLCCFSLCASLAVDVATSIYVGKDLFLVCCVHVLRPSPRAMRPLYLPCKILQSQRWGRLTSVLLPWQDRETGIPLKIPPYVACRNWHPLKIPPARVINAFPRPSATSSAVRHRSCARLPGDGELAGSGVRLARARSGLRV